MSAHDNFMDIRDAYERYEKAYEAWGRAVDGKPIDPKNILAGLHPPAPERVQLTMATRMHKALDYVIQCAQSAKKGMVRSGWSAAARPSSRTRRSGRRGRPRNTTA